MKFNFHAFCRSPLRSGFRDRDKERSGSHDADERYVRPGYDRPSYERPGLDRGGSERRSSPFSMITGLLLIFGRHEARKYINRELKILWK